MQLAATTSLLLVATAISAHADGSVTARTYYYKERATRVIQPMVDAEFAIDEETTVQGHFLVDAITSASVASGASNTAFTERRYEGGGSVSRLLADFLTLGLATRYSSEPDYKSIYVGIRSQAELAQKNTTLGLALGTSQDQISNAGAQGGISALIEEELATYLGSVSASQLLSRSTVLDVTYDLIHARGYQANLYRSVVAGGAFVPERVPEKRTRHAVFASVKQHIDPLNAAVMVGYRLYADDWGIVAHTPEVRWVQEVGDHVLAQARFRYTTQTQADFFETIYDSADPAVEPYLTDDVKLSGFDGMIIGTKTEIELSALGATGKFKDVTAIINVDYIVQNNRFGNALSASVGLQVPFDY